MDSIEDLNRLIEAHSSNTRKTISRLLRSGSAADNADELWDTFVARKVERSIPLDKEDIWKEWDEANETKKKEFLDEVAEERRIWQSLKNNEKGSSHFRR